MADDPLAPTLLLVLRRRRWTRAGDLLRTAVGELVDRGCLVLDRRPGASGRWRRRPPVLVLREGAVPAPSGGALALVASAVLGAPRELVDGREVRVVRVVAQHLSRRAGLRGRVLDAALVELEGSGLVTFEQRSVLGVRAGTRVLRTPAGERVLASAPAVRRPADGGGADVSGGGGSDDRRAELDAALAADFAASFDAGFDGGAGGDGGGS